MNTTASAPQAHSAANFAQIEALIAHAKACGKCPPVVEGVWRAIGEKSLPALEELIAATPTHPAFAAKVCSAADREIDRLLYPILGSLMNARATIEAFGEAALNQDASQKLHWPSLMDSLALVTPRDDDLDNAITQLYGVVQTAVAQALQCAYAASIEATVSASSQADSKPAKARKRSTLAAKSLEVAQ